MKKHFLVKWDVDVWADTPEAAAMKALRMQRDHNSTASIFHVLENSTANRKISRAFADCTSAMIMIDAYETEQ